MRKRIVQGILLFTLIFVLAGTMGLLGDFYNLRTLLLGLYLLVPSILAIWGLYFTVALFKTPPFEETVYPPTSTMPDKSQELNRILVSLDFSLAAELRLSAMTIWYYFNDDHSMIAHLSSNGVAGFSSYFSNGLDVTTFHPSATNMTSEKLITRIVHSSLETAFDYHKYHIEKYIAELGNPINFSDIPAMRQWEKEQDYRNLIRNYRLKSIWRFIFFTIVMLGLSIGILIYLFFDNEFTLLLMIGLTLLALLALVQLPLRAWTESVEARKELKKQGEPEDKKAKENMNPFLPPSN